MQTLDKGAAEFLGARDQVNGSGGGINDRSADDAHVSAEVPVIAATGARHVRIGRRHTICVQKTHLPVRGNDGWIVRIEGIEAVVDGGDDNNVVSSFAGDSDVRRYQRLGINLVVHRAR